MSIITAWLSDLKLGYCSQGWWLNRKFCCWEMVEEGAGGTCEDWHEWTGWVGIQWALYVGMAVSLALSLSSALLPRAFSWEGRKGAPTSAELTPSLPIPPQKGPLRLYLRLHRQVPRPLRGRLRHFRD